jgi:hypothetical protein
MSAAARSVFAFGCYAVLAGLGLVVMPGVVLGLLGFPAPADGWVRVVGMLAICVGFFHMTSARNELEAYLRASVTIRLLFAVGLTGLVIARVGALPLMLFAIVDVLGALWTAVALRRVPQSSVATA